MFAQDLQGRSLFQKGFTSTALDSESLARLKHICQQALHKFTANGSSTSSPQPESSQQETLVIRLEERELQWELVLFPIQEDDRTVALGGIVVEQLQIQREELGKDNSCHYTASTDYMTDDLTDMSDDNDHSENQQMKEAVRESEERHLTLFQNMKQGVVYHAADGHTTAANESALRLLGLAMDQMLGKSPMDPQWRFIYEDGSTIPVEKFPAVIALSGTPVTNMILGVRRKENDICWVQLDAMPRFRPGKDKPYEAHTIITDIAEAKQVELNLRMAKEKAEQADHLKSAFLAIASHEMRTPLNGIMGHLDLVLSTGLDDEHRQENLEDLRGAMHSGNLLVSILQDILDLSKTEAGELDIMHNQFSLKDMIGDSMKLGEACCRHRKKGQIELFHVIETGISDAICGDHFRLQQGTNSAGVNL